MSACTVKLLQAAAEIAGGTRALADRLGITETLLAKFLADSPELPDTLLLPAVDIILADRQMRFPSTAELAVAPRAR
jgi:hypothetical protein